MNFSGKKLFAASLVSAGRIVTFASLCAFTIVLVFSKPTCVNSNGGVVKQVSRESLANQRPGVIESDVFAKPTCVNSKGSVMKQVSRESLASQRPGVNETDVPVVVMIHTSVSSLGPGNIHGDSTNNVLIDLLLSCERTGVLQLASNVTLNVVGDASEYARVKHFVYEESRAGRFANIDIVNKNQDPGTWEFSSINLLLDYAKELHDEGKNAHLLYLHTKGLRMDGDYIAKWHWRKYLEYWMLERQQDARLMLKLGYDTVGVNAINPPGGLVPEREYTRVNPGHNWHYSGNFWWSTAAHFSKHDHLALHTGRPIDLVERLLAENIILSRVPEMCAGVMHQADNAHVFSVRDIPSFELWDKPTGTELLQTSTELSSRI